MLPFRYVLLGAMTCLLLLSASGACHAGPWITVTACDSVQIAGVHHPRVTFSVTNHDSYWVISTIQACPPHTGAPTDSCTALLVSGPTDHWSGEVSVCRGANWFVSNPFDPAGIFIAPGQTLGGFQLVVDRTDCCFSAAFSNVELTPFAFDSLCFTCDGPVAARSSSWGQLKSHYR
jgi:hypothetical protein